jgi:hypothetical protein
MTLTPDEVVARAARLVRSGSEGALRSGDPAGVERLERALERRSRRYRGRPGRLGPRWLAVAAVLITVGAIAVLLGRDRPLTFRVANGRVSGGEYIASEATDAVVVFSDHSEMGLDRGTRLRVSELAVRGARIMLEGGQLHVRIRPRPRASWAIDAGPYVVQVTGTEFDLEWRADAQTLDLTLHKGAVTVNGPLANGGIRMEAGQHLVANAVDGSLSLVDDRSDPSVVQAPPSAPETPVATPQVAPPPSPAAALVRVAPVAPVASARPESNGWAALVAQGQFDSVLEAAQRRGVERSLAEGSLVDLSALADAARYARRGELASRALVAQRTRFPGSVQARDAAFFLGGLAENQGDAAGALGWYDTYLRENAGGVYAPEASGRQMMLVQRVRGPGDARPVAAQYLQRYPDGTYAASARKILQAP